MFIIRSLYPFANSANVPQSDPERAPLLPGHAGRQPQATGTAASASSSRESREIQPKNRPGIARNPADAFNRSSYQQMMQRLSNHSLYAENGYPNWELLRRVMKKLVYQTGVIATRAGISLGTGVATAFVTRAVLNQFVSNDKSALEVALLESVRYLVDGTPVSTASRAFGIDEATARMLLTMAQFRAEDMASGSGASFALATQLSTAMVSVTTQIVDLFNNWRPDSHDDLKECYRFIADSNASLILSMPHEEKTEILLLQRKITEALSPQSKTGSSTTSVDIQEIVAMIQIFDLLLIMAGNRKKPAVKLWHNDQHSLSAEDHERIAHSARLEASILDQVVPGENGRTALQTFINRLRMNTAHRIDALTDGKAGPTMNTLALAGQAGTGKTHLAGEIVKLSGVDAVEMPFDVLLDLLEAPNDKRRHGAAADTGGLASPYEKYKELIPLMLKPNGGIVICNEANLTGKKFDGTLSGKGEGVTDPDYLAQLKRAFELDKEPVIKIPTGVAGVNFRIHIKGMSLVLTTNDRPNVSAITRRIGVAELNKVPEKVRRDVAKETLAYWTDRVVPALFAFTPVQLEDLKSQMAGLMEFIINESVKDAGPANLKSTIGDVVEHLALKIASAGAAAGDPQPSGTIEGVETEHGTRWVETPEAAISPDMRAFIQGALNQRREVDHVMQAWEKYQAMLLDQKNQGISMPPAAEVLFQHARDAALNASDTLKFLQLAMRTQWADKLQGVPEDIRKAFNALAHHISSNISSLWGNDESMRRTSSYFKDAEQAVHIMDRIMRIPHAPRNLFHWETGGNAEKRYQQWQTLKELSGLIGEMAGEQSGKAFSEFMFNYAKSTMPFVGNAGDNDVVSTMVISGPKGSGKTWLAKEIANKLGMDVVEIGAAKYLSMYRDEEGTAAARAKAKDSANFDPKTILGPLEEVFKPSGQPENGTHASSDMQNTFNTLLIVNFPDIDKHHEIREELIDTLRSYAENPKIMLPDVAGGISFSLNRKRVLTIVTTTGKPTPDMRWLCNIPLGEATPQIRRAIADRVFKQQVDNFQGWDFSNERKRALETEAASVMGYILERSSDIRQPENLQFIINNVFQHLQRTAAEKLLTSQEGIDESSEDKPGGVSDQPIRSWADIPQIRTGELIEVANAAISQVLKPVRAVPTAQAATVAGGDGLPPTEVPRDPAQPGPDVSSGKKKITDYFKPVSTKST